MLHRVTRKTIRLIAVCPRLICRGTRSCWQKLRDLWAAHRDLVTSNSAYAAAVAGAAAGLVGQVRLDKALMVVVSAAVAIYAAIRQTGHHAAGFRPDELEPDPWSESWGTVR